MIDHVERRFLSFFLAVLMIFSVVPVNAFAASSRTQSGDIGNIAWSATIPTETDNSADLGSVEVNGTTMTITAKAEAVEGCSNWSHNETTTTVTFTNKGPDEAIISFDYDSSVTIADNEYSTPGTFASVSLTPNATVKVEFKSPSTGENKIGGGDVATLNLTNIKLTANVTRNMTVVPGTNGTVSVAGTAISANKTQSVAFADGLNVSAKAASGYKFLAWVDENNTVLATTADANIKPEHEGLVASALFVPASENGHWIGNKKIFAEFQDALDAAKAGDKSVKLMDSATLSKSYEIPDGVSVLIPHNQALSAYGANPIAIARPEGTLAAPTPYSTLTLGAGVTLTVRGALEVAAQHYVAHGGKYDGGRVIDKYGYIKMNSDSHIDIKSGGTLYAWGYVSGSGRVTANSGATVYEKFQISDYRGGGITSIIVPARVFPFNQYYVQNVEVPETIHAGATLICHAGIYGSEVVTSSIEFIGSNGMFNLGSGSRATKRYDAASDRLIIDVEGQVGLNGISLMGYNTANFVLPINHNITVNVNSGITTINQDVMLQPGATVNVDRDAYLALASGKKFYLMDSDNWGKYCMGATMRPIYYTVANGTAVKRSALSDAKINLNGTAVIQGQAYASTAGALIESAGKTGVVILMNNAPSGTTNVKQSAITSASQAFSATTNISVGAALLTNADGTTVNTKGGTQYTTYVYDTMLDKWVTTAVNIAPILTYDANGGTGTMEPVTVNYQNTGLAFQPLSFALAENTFTRAGYEFTGWGYGPVAAAEAVADVAAVEATASVEKFAQTFQPGDFVTISANTTLYAIWNAESFGLKIVLDENDNTNEQSVPCGTDLSTVLPENPTKDGYRFTGWIVTNTDDNNAVLETVPETMPAHSVTFTANWEKVYTLTFLDENGDVLKDTEGNELVYTYAENENVTATYPEYTKDGYTITWNAEIPEKLTADIEISAIATPDSFTIYFYDGETLKSDAEAGENGKVTIIGNLTSDDKHKTFKGWTATKGGTTADEAYTAGAEITLTKDLTLYAVWETTTCADNNMDHKCDTCDTVLTYCKDSLTSHKEEPATCLEPGTKAYWSCNICGNYYLDANATVGTDEDGLVITAKGHTFINAKPAQAATCLAAGNVAYKECSVCELYFAGDAAKDSTAGETSNTKFIKAQLDHSYTGAIKKDADGKDATHSFQCVNGCNAYGGAVKHTWNAGVVNPAPDCLGEGVKTYTCTVAGCGATYTETVDAKGHSFGATTAKVDATCEAAGNEAYKQCTVCELYFAGDAAINATDGKADASAFAIAQKNHSYTGAIKSDGNGKDATHSFQCVNGCNAYGGTVKHTWNGGVETTAPGCETEGMKTFTCTTDDCGATYTEVIGATGHAYPETPSSYTINENGTHTANYVCGNDASHTKSDATVTHTYTNGVCVCGAKKTVTLSWNVDGTVTTTTQTFGEAIVLPTAPGKVISGATVKTFAGWQGYTENMTVPAADTTFTALWNEKTYDISTLYVNSSYSASNPKEGEAYYYGINCFTNYSAAYSYAVANNTKATIVIEQNTSLSGFTFDNNHKSYSGLSVIVEDGAKMGNALSKWDMAYKVTLKPGAVLEMARPASTSVSNAHLKSTLTIGEAGAQKRAVLDFLSDTYQDGDIYIRYNGSIVANNADIYVQDLDAQGNLTASDSTITVDGAFASATFYATTLTNTTMTVGGKQITGGLSDFAEKTYDNRLGKVTMENSTITFNSGSVNVAATVTLNGASSIDVADGMVITNNNKIVLNGTSSIEDQIVLAKTSATVVGPENMDVVASAELAEQGYRVVYENGTYKLSKIYTITWKVEGQDDLTTTVKEGATPAYPNGTPTKAADDKYSYTFASWTPAIETATKDATYTATWNKTAKTYTLTIDLGEHGTFSDGTTEKNVSANYGTSPEYPEIKANEGYKLTGWTVTIGEETKDATSLPTEMLATNATYTAKWELIDVTVTFEDGENETVVSGKYFESKLVPTPAAKEGYTFQGWAASTAENAEIVYAAGGSITLNNAVKDKTYYAKWQINTYRVTCVNGVTSETETVDWGTEITVKSLSDTASHTFTGWQDSDGKTYSAGDKITVKADLTLTAQWKANTYTITWKVEGQDDVTTTVEHGQTPVYNGTPTKEADAQYTYTFAGWGNIVPATGDATYTAQFTPVLRSYEITFVVDGEETKVSTKYGETPVYNEGKNPTKAEDAYYSYIFAGWKNAAGTVSMTLPEITGEATFTATWTTTPVEHSITFMVDGEVWHVVKGAYGTDVDYSDLTTPSKTGYTFAWDKAAEEWPAKIPGEDMVITGSYTIKQYTITFRNHELYQSMYSFEDIVITKDYGAEITEADLAEVTELNNAITGLDISWYVISNDPDDPFSGEGAYKYTIPKEMPAENIEVYAFWRPESYPLTIRSSIDNSILEEKKIDYNIAIDSAEDFRNYWSIEIEKHAPTGYHFAEYLLDGEPLEYPYVHNTAKALNLVANFVPNNYTVTFMNGESEHAKITAPYGSTITLPENPTMAGYTFAGWVDAEGNAADLSTMPLGGMTVYATFTVDTFKVNFFATKGDATAYKSFDVTYGTKLTATVDDPATEEVETDAGKLAELLDQVGEPTLEGHIWKGWDTSKVPETMPAEAVNIYGTWNVNSYTITADGEEYTFEYGADVSIPDPTKEGHTFDGWEEEVPRTMPAKNLVLTAKWNVNTYTITFDVEGIEAIRGEYNSEINNWPKAPTMAGHTFKGWDKDNDGTADITTALDKMPGENLTLKPVWTKNTVYITWNIDGEETTDAYKYGETIVAPTATKDTDAKWSYVFTGWAPALPETATESKTYTAQFGEDEAVKYNVKFMDGEQEVYSTRIAWNGQVTLEGFTAPAQTGKTLTWTVEGDDATFPYAMDTKDVTFVAKWTPITYTIKFYHNASDTEPAHTISGEYGAAISYEYIAPNGYELDHWVVKGTSTPYALDKTMPAENLELVAINKAKSYDVIFMEDGVETIRNSVTYKQQVPVATPTTTKVEGYTFQGWFDGEGVKLDWDYTMPAHDVTFTAKWTYTGWHTDEVGTTYLIEDAKAYFTTWATIDGQKYWFNAEGYIVKDITLIDGGYYAFDHESGKFLSNMTGIYTAKNGDLYYVVDGIAVENKGLVRIIDNNHIHYYYFGCDATGCTVESCTGAGQFKAQRNIRHWVENNNGMLIKGGYTFGDDGVIEHTEDTNRNGIEIIDNVKYYLMDGVKVHMGLILDRGYYYYARSSGALVVNESYWVSASKLNGLDLKAGTYNFDEEGRIVFGGGKTGIYAENDTLYYYVDGAKNYAGLIQYTGDLNNADGSVTENVYNNSWIYVNTQGEVKNSCKYWISKTNGKMIAMSYTFNEVGIMQDPAVSVGEAKNGVYAEGGSLYYYVDGARNYAGLIKYTGDLNNADGSVTENVYNDNWIYVNTQGEVKNGCDYWISKNNGYMKNASYNFDENGIMTNPNPIA